MTGRNTINILSLPYSSNMNVCIHLILPRAIFWILSVGRKAKKKVRRYRKGSGIDNLKEEEVSESVHFCITKGEKKLFLYIFVQFCFICSLNFWQRTRATVRMRFWSGMEPLFDQIKLKKVVWLDRILKQSGMEPLFDKIKFEEKK